MTNPREISIYRRPLIPAHFCKDVAIPHEYLQYVTTTNPDGSVWITGYHKADDLHFIYVDIVVWNNDDKKITLGTAKLTYEEYKQCLPANFEQTTRHLNPFNTC